MDSRPDKEILDQQIEQYLMRVASHLHGAKRQAVNDTLEEIRQHLSTSRDALIADGLSADQASQRAMQRFGSSEKVGASLARHLTPYDFPINVYRVLRICRFTQYAACVLGIQQLISLPAWTAVIIGISLYTISLVVEESRRFTTPSKSIPGFCRHIGRIQRELERANISRIVNLSGRRSHLYLLNMVLMSVVSIHEHIYSLIVLFAVSAAEFVLIRKTASRIGANIPA